MQNKFLIGTRGSLLAVTQCTLIKNEIEAKTGAKFDLLKIKTQGDQITNKPLWQLEGKDFFTKELDDALLSDKIDLVVHSYKDLGSERPEGISLGCITERKYPHDILLMKKSKIKGLANKKEILIGTSSPRRIVNAERFLIDYLPNTQNDAYIKCETLRGNVNTRIEKLLSDQYDGIILALAGLERLANKEDSKEILKELTKDLTFMIMPLSIFPASASQGALAIEYHESQKEKIYPILQSVHHEQTAEEIARERKAFNSYGGGCHLAVGINVKKAHDFYIHTHRGMVDDKEIEVNKLEGYNYLPFKGQKLFDIKSTKNALIKKTPISNKSKINENLFVTSSHCFHNIESYNSIWTAGNQTMRKVISRGHWVNGSAEGLGHHELNNLKSSEAIKLMLGDSDWKVMTHDKGESIIGEVIPSYKHELVDGNLEEDLMQADIILWSSFIEFNHYTQLFPELKDKQHATGLGKTYQKLSAKGIEVIPCINKEQLLENL